MPVVLTTARSSMATPRSHLRSPRSVPMCREEGSEPATGPRIRLRTAATWTMWTSTRSLWPWPGTRPAPPQPTVPRLPTGPPRHCRSSLARDSSVFRSGRCGDAPWAAGSRCRRGDGSKPGSRAMHTIRCCCSATASPSSRVRCTPGRSRRQSKERCLPVRQPGTTRLPSCACPPCLTFPSHLLEYSVHEGLSA